jgi:3-dehydroquinate dehydratase / shikimate dehydrogenase
MSLIAASIAVHAADEVSAALERARSAAAAGASLIEWRIDGLAEEAEPIPATLRLVRESPKPCIVTCRPVEEGGEYRGNDQSRISLLEALAASDHPPRYIDVELATYRRSENLKQKVRLAVSHPNQPRDLRTSLILSAHDFDRRPRDLLQGIEAMTNDSACAVIKVAWHARSLRDNLEAFELLASRRKPMIALCMGGFGLMSRVLAPKFGGLLTFASNTSTEVTAPGQPSIADLKNLYRFDAISATTKVYGVIGWPVEHSRSPHVHNAGFGAIGFDGVYLPLPIPPEYEHFKATVSAMIDAKGLDFRGASVTLPHKENLLRFVQERGGRIERSAGRIGAANTLIVGSAGAVACANTDAPAAVDALCEGMRIPREALLEKRIAVLGAGGVARAVVSGLIETGATVVVFNRSEDRAGALIEHFEKVAAAEGQAKDAGGRAVLGRMDAIGCGCFHAIINCTPVGMQGGPTPQDSPLPDDVPLNDEVTVMDTVYAPARTPLIQEAESRGARVITGADMFLKQAAMQFEMWTGKPAPMGALRATLTS